MRAKDPQLDPPVTLYNLILFEIKQLDTVHPVSLFLHAWGVGVEGVV